MRYEKYIPSNNYRMYKRFLGVYFQADECIYGRSINYRGKHYFGEKIAQL